MSAQHLQASRGCSESSSAAWADSIPALHTPQTQQHDTQRPAACPAQRAHDDTAPGRRNGRHRQVCSARSTPDPAPGPSTGGHPWYPWADPRARRGGGLHCRAAIRHFERHGCRGARREQGGLRREQQHARAGRREGMRCRETGHVGRGEARAGAERGGRGDGRQRHGREHRIRTGEGGRRRRRRRRAAPRRRGRGRVRRLRQEDGRAVWHVRAQEAAAGRQVAERELVHHGRRRRRRHDGRAGLCELCLLCWRWAGGAVPSHCIAQCQCRACVPGT